MNFVDREDILDRLSNALSRQRPQFIVLYGRRRIGKSTLIKRLIDLSKGDIYYLADTTGENNQARLFAQLATMSMPDFDKPQYPDWEALLTSLNRAIDRRITVCIDEFPYLVAACPTLPSVLQKLVDSKRLKFDLIICGSSQRMMQGFVLDSREPLYGRADEIIRLDAIPARYLPEYLGCDCVQAVREYALWGGVPRYWELRRDYDSLEQAVNNLIFSPYGVLYDEPARLLQDEMRDTASAASILSIIGNGANKLSEIASRAGKKATDIMPQLSRLRELALISREVPYGQNEKKSRQGLYHIVDPLLRFHYRFVHPMRSLIAIGKTDVVNATFIRDGNDFTAQCWEELCRAFVTGNTINGILYKEAKRWWGKYKDLDTGRTAQAELDVVAESFDGKHLLVGECKWTECEDAAALTEKILHIAQGLPFATSHEVHPVLFLKQQPSNAYQTKILLPQQIIGAPTT